MLKVGLTGGIGSGKTTVAHVFEVLGVPVFYADDAAKKMMNEDDDIKKQIIENFGVDSYLDGKLNRSYISKIIFSNPEKINVINSIIHPATIAQADIWMKKNEARKLPYSIKEAALIFEANAQDKLDFVIGVSSPLELRIERVMQRDTISKNDVEARIQKQMKEEEKMDLCDFVLVNDDQQLLIPQVLELHHKLLQLNSNLSV